jgi:bile acid:Na+ symporter, BASS family
VSRPRRVLGALTFWVLVATAAAFFRPDLFVSWGSFETRRLIVPVTQFIMFGMGATLTIEDFRRALTRPRSVFIGMILQFMVMPLSGWAVATLFGFEPEIAAGLILLGACSGGVASNVMTYLARGDVALSVTMTACSTLAAPLATPLAMKLLAGRLLPIDGTAMLFSIVQIVLLPVAAGLVANRLLRRHREIIDRALPVCSMIAICLNLAFTTAGARDRLLTVGLALVGAAIIHNTVGYLLGYFGGRAARLSEREARTVTFEVGIQNAGMGMGLAIQALGSADAALPCAVFAVWMNISGSILASRWRHRPAG